MSKLRRQSKRLCSWTAGDLNDGSDDSGSDGLGCLAGVAMNRLPHHHHRHGSLTLADEGLEEELRRHSYGGEVQASVARGGGEPLVDESATTPEPININNVSIRQQRCTRQRQVQVGKPKRRRSQSIDSSYRSLASSGTSSHMGGDINSCLTASLTKGANLLDGMRLVGGHDFRQVKNTPHGGGGGGQSSYQRYYPGKRTSISSLTTTSSRSTGRVSNNTHNSSIFSSLTSSHDACGYLRRLSMTEGGDHLSSNSFHQPTISANQKEEESYIKETELKFKGEEGFDEHVITDVKDMADSLRLLRRTRAISSLGNRLLAAPDEATCIEEVSRLLVLMFGVERVGFGMLTGSDHFLLKRVNVLQKNQKDASAAAAAGSEDPSSASNNSSFELQYLESDCRRPLKDTAAGICVNTRKEHYTPRTGTSPFATHKAFHRNGVNTVLATPILVNGGKCAGCIVLTRKREDGFKKKSDRVLISDIGLLLGANIYAKRLLADAEKAKKRSREMLHSMIPPKVLEKIECYWDVDSDEYRDRKKGASSLEGSQDNTSVTAEGSLDSTTSARNNNNNDNHRQRSNSWYVAQSDWTSEEIGLPRDMDRKNSVEGVKEKVALLKNMNRADDDSEDDNMGVIVNTSEMELAPTSRALYADNVKNVCIIFTDIVGFSKMSLDVAPRKMMDMLQNLFNKFDELCDVHGVLKLETIGDAYMCATNLLEEEEDGDSVQDAAMRALEMAKDMIIEATEVTVPSLGYTEESWKNYTVQIRVGIHVGDVTCGVLGQRLPKFTTCGKAVNMAARMEQNSEPSCIRVTKDFHDIIGDVEKGWKPKEVTPLKNMGEVETYLLDPLEMGIGEVMDQFSEVIDQYHHPCRSDDNSQ